MADRDDAVLAIKQYGKQYEPAARYKTAYLGDGNGNVYTSQANYHLCRYPLTSSPPMEIFNVKTPAIDNLRVIIGYTSQQPNLLQVIDVADPRVDITSGDETTIITAPYAYLPLHAPNHMYLNVDPVYINWRQITPLGVFPTNPVSMSVTIRAGYIPRPGPDIFVDDQVVDLTSHVPVSGARYVLISYDTYGNVVITDGTIQTSFSVLTFADIPDTPSDCWRSCAVVLYSGQTAIVETRSEIDFLDLRFPEETSPSTSVVTPPPTATYFFRHRPGIDNIGYLQPTNVEPTVSLTTVALAGLDQGVMPFVTYTGSPNLNVLPFGIWKVFFKCALLSAGETVDFYFKFYKQGPAPTYTTVLLGTSTTSGTLNTSQTVYTVTISITSGTIANDDTLSLVLYTNVHTGGTANIVFQVEGDSLTRLEMPGSSSSGSGSIVLPTGQIFVGDSNSIAQATDQSAVVLATQIFGG